LGKLNVTVTTSTFETLLPELAEKYGKDKEL
jgi:hypothetical protein